MASTTMTSTAGSLAQNRCSTRISTIPDRPIAAAAGTTSPCATPRANAAISPSRPLASVENPNSLGS